MSRTHRGSGSRDVLVRTQGRVAQRNDRGGWWPGEFGGGMYNPICIAGPQMNKKIMRKLISMTPLTDEQVTYLRHDGAIDAARSDPRHGPHGHRPGARDPDDDHHEPALRGERGRRRRVLPGVQQLVSSTGARRFPTGSSARRCCRCRARTGRCRSCIAWPSGDSRSALIRPIDARGAYPNDIGRYALEAGEVPIDQSSAPSRRPGLVLGMHTFPADVLGRTAGPGLARLAGRAAQPGRGRLPDAVVHLRDAGLARADSARRIPRPLPQPQDGGVRVE